MTFTAIISTFSFIFATGAVEADSYFVAFGFVILGIVTGFITIYLQSKKEEESKGLYYKEK